MPRTRAQLSVCRAGGAKDTFKELHPALFPGRTLLIAVKADDRLAPLMHKRLGPRFLRNAGIPIRAGEG
jgi:hypothetical protein